jgi:MFS family permease
VLSRRSPIPVPLLVTAGAIATTLLGDSMLYAVMPSRPGAWGLSIAAVGVLLAANRLVRLLSNPLAALAFHRFGPHPSFAAAMALAAVATLTYGWATAFAALLAARLLWGVCWSALRLGGYWVVLDEATDSSRGTLMGVYTAIVRIGSVAGAVAGGLLTDAFGHRRTLTIFAAVIAVAGVAWHVSSRDSLRHEATPVDDVAGNGLQAILTNRRLLVVGASGLVVALAFSGLVTASLGFFLRELYGEQVPIAGAAVGVSSLTGLLLGSQWAIGLPLAPTAGLLSDRFGRSAVAQTGFVLGAIGLVVLALTASVWLTVAGALLAFSAATILAVLLATAAGDLAPLGRRAAVMTGYATFLDIGAALGPLVGLSFADEDTLRVLYGGAAALLIAVALSLRRSLSVSHTGRSD